MILCYKCGIVISPNTHNLCNCCALQVLTNSDKLKKSINVEFCRGCERYLAKPRTWNKYDWGSRELLIYLIKCNSSLNAFNIIDSNFIYTEEHSKRINLKILLENDGIREEVVINYVIKNKQCPDCEKIEAKQHWRAIVQVRHKLQHQRIFIHLEQLIIKNKMYTDTTNIKMRKNGIDFYFTNKTEALKLVNFIESVLPVKIIESERLISKDIHTSKSNYKHSYSVEIAPLCVDDLVILEKELANSLGCGTVVLVKKVSNTIILFDPYNLKTVKMNNSQFWNNKDKMQVLQSSKNFVKFNIIEIYKPLIETSEHRLVPLAITRNNDAILDTKAALLKGINEDDVLLGYDLSTYNSNYKTEDIPDIIIVRKDVNRDIKWKTEVNSDEYYYYLDDIKKDKEIVSNMCEMEIENKQIIDKLETLLR